MREQRIGTATFIPLDTIKVPSINEQLRQIDPSVKLVIDVMKFDSNFKRAVHYACGNTIVCETIEEAKDLAFNKSSRRGFPKVKVVTVDGVLIRKSGLMTGGISTSLESRARGWEQKDIQALKDKRDALMSELSDVGRILRKQKDDIVETQLAGLDTRIDYAKKDFKFTEDKIKEIREEIKTLEEKLEEMQPSIDKLSKSTEDRSQNIEKLTKVIRKVEKRVFKDLAEKLGIPIEEIHDYEEKQIRKVKEITQKRLEFSNTISRLQNQLNYEKNHDSKDSITKASEELAKDKDRIEKLQGRFVKIKVEIDEYTKQIKAHEDAINKTRSKVNEKDDDVTKIKRQIDDVMNKLGAIQKQYASAEGMIEQFRAKRHNIYQNCKVEEIWELLPVERDEEEEEDEEMEIEDSSQLNYEKEDKIKLNFKKLPKNLKQVENQEAIAQQFKNDLHALSGKIDKIDPNLKALVHLKKVKARLGETKKDLQAARSASDQAANKFLKVQNARIKKFNSAYAPIAKEIDAIYKALTAGKDGSKPGGTAYLNVDNTNEPYLGGVRYHVMPPNKRFRDMEQLSGGEKTVAALALLFAMHSIQPAPFFLLDEVDAALDKVNIAKVARYLESRKSDIQFIVVSLQDRFYENADGLIGVMFDHNQRCSGTLTLDLTAYPDR